jgi:hypothetical protein
MSTTDAPDLLPVPDELTAAVAIDGEFYNPLDKGQWKPAEARQLRNLVRAATGHADIANLFDPRIDGELDLLPAVILVVRQRTDPNYTWQKALDAAWDEPALERMEQEALAAWYAEHPDRDPRAAVTTSDGDDGEAPADPPAVPAKRAGTKKR